MRERINKWDYMKLKTFSTTKDMFSKLKKPSTEWEKIFASYTSDKGWITRIDREVKKLNCQKINICDRDIGETMHIYVCKRCLH
jgi:hypothetical protein